MKNYYPLIALGALSITSGWAQAAMPVDFSQLVEKVSPAVVSVTVKESVSQQELMQQQIPELFRHFFGNQIIIPQQPTPQERTGFGSAFFISSDGYLVTNYHVIKDASKVTIVMQDNREFNAEVVGGDERTDVALLKVKGNNFPALKIGNVDQLKVGEPVLAIGSPFGFDYSASAGIVSAKSRTMSNDTAVPFIQTDVALNPGNSGGPLFNKNGEVVGINSRIFSGTGGYMGLSFSIPADVAMDVVQQLKTTGKVSRGYLGVMLQDVDRNLADAYKLDKPEGALILRVSEDSPAEKAGLQAGDLILSFNGQQLKRTADLVGLVARSSQNQKVDLVILRDQQRKNIKVTLEAAPDQTTANTKNTVSTPASNSLGMAVRDLTQPEKMRYKIEGVAVQDLSINGAAAKSGIRTNDIIYQIANKKVRNTTDLKHIIEKLPNNGTVAVYLLRQNQPVIVGLRLEK